MKNKKMLIFSCLMLMSGLVQAAEGKPVESLGATKTVSKATQAQHDALIANHEKIMDGTQSYFDQVKIAEASGKKNDIYSDQTKQAMNEIALGSKQAIAVTHAQVLNEAYSNGLNIDSSQIINGEDYSATTMTHEITSNDKNKIIATVFDARTGQTLSITEKNVNGNTAITTFSPDGKTKTTVQTTLNGRNEASIKNLSAADQITNKISGKGTKTVTTTTSTLSEDGVTWKTVGTPVTEFKNTTDMPIEAKTVDSKTSATTKPSSDLFNSENKNIATSKESDAKSASNEKNSNDLTGKTDLFSSNVKPTSELNNIDIRALQNDIGLNRQYDLDIKNGKIDEFTKKVNGNKDLTPYQKARAQLLRDGFDFSLEGCFYRFLDAINDLLYNTKTTRSITHEKNGVTKHDVVCHFYKTENWAKREIDIQKDGSYTIQDKYYDINGDRLSAGNYNKYNANGQRVS